MAAALQPVIRRSAQFDHTGRYRYRLERLWDATRPAVTLVMLNPSRADQYRDDPTLRRCICLAQRWHYGSLIVVNLFAYCSASPRCLQTIADPVGPENNDYVLQACQATGHSVLAWGNGGALYTRDRQVLALLAPYRDRLYCLGLNRTGQPRHPLYVPNDSQLFPWGAVSTDQ